MKKFLKAAALLLWMGVIFYMSAQPQLESEVTSNLATELLYKIYSFLFPAGIPLADFFDRYGQFIRKLAHFTEFMILGILIKTNYMEYCKKNTFLVPLLLSAAYAVSDEFHQLFVEGRFCSVKDMLIDTSGAFLGILVYHLVAKGWKRKEDA